MKQIQTFTSTYTADVSGVPSALYELSGMVVMHDASGCNSTYNTHDEPRYYDSKSMVYITGLTEMEAIMGDDQKMVDDIVKAAKKLKPKFIAIAGTPIPMITGCDIEANAKVIETLTSIPTLGINTNGMHSYVEGAGDAMLAYAKRFVKKNVKKKKNSINILGATPIDFSINGQIESIEKFFIKSNVKVISNFALHTSAKDLRNAGEASVNLVVSSVGIKLAEYLKKEFGTPYIIGVPYGKKMQEDMIKAIKDAKDEITYVSDIAENYKDENIYIIGESVTAKSLAKAIFDKYGHTAKVLSGVELGNTKHGDTIKGLSAREKVALESQDVFLEDEDEIRDTISDAKIVIADPLYKPIIPDDAIFVEYPHEGFSGRLFRKNILNLVEVFK